MDPPKRKRQSEELAVWNERLLAWEAHKKSGAPPRRLLEWCMDNGAPIAACKTVQYMYMCRSSFHIALFATEQCYCSGNTGTFII